MSYAREYDWVPISNSIPEYHFGKSGKVNMWIEFEKSNGQLWRGSFECGFKGERKIIEFDDYFFVFADGIGYKINNDSNSLEFRTENEYIFAHKVNEKEIVVVNWKGLFILNERNEIVLIKNLLDLDLFELIGENSISIIGKFESSEFQWERRYYRLNKETKKIEISKSEYEL